MEPDWSTLPDTCRKESSSSTSTSFRHRGTCVEASSADQLDGELACDSPQLTCVNRVLHIWPAGVLHLHLPLCPWCAAHASIPTHPLPDSPDETSAVPPSSLLPSSACTAAADVPLTRTLCRFCSCSCTLAGKAGPHNPLSYTMSRQPHARQLQLCRQVMVPDYCSPRDVFLSASCQPRFPPIASFSNTAVDRPQAPQQHLASVLGQASTPASQWATQTESAIKATCINAITVTISIPHKYAACLMGKSAPHFTHQLCWAGHAHTQLAVMRQVQSLVKCNLED